MRSKSLFLALAVWLAASHSVFANKDAAEVECDTPAPAAARVATESPEGISEAELAALKAAFYTESANVGRAGQCADAASRLAGLVSVTG